MVISHSYVSLPGGKWNNWLVDVGGIPTPLKNMTSSVGMMKFPIQIQSHKNVSNHQPVMMGNSSNIIGKLRKYAFNTWKTFWIES